MLRGFGPGASGNPVILMGLPPGPHKVVEAEHHESKRSRSISSLDGISMTELAAIRPCFAGIAIQISKATVRSGTGRYA
jgi:hypothetical protein